MNERNTILYHELYKMYAGEMYAYGMAFNIGKEIVLDAIHDVFLRIIERENEIVMQENPKFYLLISLRNQLFSIKRREISFESIDDTKNTYFSIVVNGLEDVVEEEEERDELISQIETILNELTNRQREVIYLRYMQNLSYEEIAELLHITPKAARKLTYRAIDRIKELYGAPFYIFIQLLSIHASHEILS